MIRTISLLLILLGVIVVVQADIKKDEEVVLFPTYAHLTDQNQVRFDIHGWIFERENNSISRKAILKMLGSVTKFQGQEKEIFDQRIQLFLVDNEGKKELTLQIGDYLYEMNKSKANGHFITPLEITKQQITPLTNKNGFFKVNIVTPGDDERHFAGKVQLIPSHGISVISDIDDTIKKTQVINRSELIKNSLAREFTPISGMADCYQLWARQKVVFHYVSGSPWQFYSLLAQFLNQHHFPEGSFHLRYFRMKDTSFIKFLKAKQFDYKTGIIEEIIRRFPKRKYILVGDSGEQDPQIYYHLAKQYPQQIAAVFIRKIEGTEEKLKEYQEQQIAPVKWKVFSDPQELQKLKLEMIYKN